MQFLGYTTGFTVFENHITSLIQQCERSELRLHFVWDKSSLKYAKNGPFWRVFRKHEACSQTELPDRSVLIGQNIDGKCQNFGRLYNFTFFSLDISSFCIDFKRKGVHPHFSVAFNFFLRTVMTSPFFSSCQIL